MTEVKQNFIERLKGRFGAGPSLYGSRSSGTKSVRPIPADTSAGSRTKKQSQAVAASDDAVNGFDLDEELARGTNPVLAARMAAQALAQGIPVVRSTAMQDRCDSKSGGSRRVTIQETEKDDRSVQDGVKSAASGTGERPAPLPFFLKSEELSPALGRKLQTASSLNKPLKSALKPTLSGIPPGAPMYLSLRLEGDDSDPSPPFDRASTSDRTNSPTGPTPAPPTSKTPDPSGNSLQSLNPAPKRRVSVNALLPTTSGGIDRLLPTPPGNPSPPPFVRPRSQSRGLSSMTRSSMRLDTPDDSKPMLEPTRSVRAPRNLSMGPRPDLLSLGRTSSLARSQVDDLPPADNLYWLGEGSNRYFNLRKGNRMIRESELRLLHTVWIEVNALVGSTEGSNNIVDSNAIRAYLLKVSAKNMSRVRLASNLISNLDKNGMKQRLTFEDFVRLTFPACDAGEKRFLVESAAELHNSLMRKQVGDTEIVIESLNPNVLMANSIYHKLDKEKNGFIDIDIMIKSMLGSNSELEERVLRRQLGKIVSPMELQYQKIISKENFLKYILYHLSQEEVEACVSLADWNVVVDGYIAVLSRYVNRAHD